MEQRHPLDDVVEDARRRDFTMNAVYHDPLTGLQNRQSFTDSLADALQVAERDGTSLALLFIDLDRFKSVNDSLGHAVGDDILKMVAKDLEGSLRVAGLEVLRDLHYTTRGAADDRPLAVLRQRRHLPARRFDVGQRELHVGAGLEGDRENALRKLKRDYEECKEELDRVQSHTLFWRNKVNSLREELQRMGLPGLQKDHIAFAQGFGPVRQMVPHRPVLDPEDLVKIMGVQRLGPGWQQCGPRQMDLGGAGQDVLGVKGPSHGVKIAQVLAGNSAKRRDKAAPAVYRSAKPET